jgi:chemosensory pili system protein ChpA (sensor histidine kinase/response regulator)
MTAFGLEDVRESYTNDVTRFLSEVENNAKLIVSAATLTIPTERNWQQPVDSMVVGLHGIVGSSSLIGVETMTATARQLETIAQSAAESIRMLKWHATRLKRIASVCLDGAIELRMILNHELDGRAEQAHDRSAALTARLDSVVTALESGPQPERVPAESTRMPAIPSQLIKIPDLPRRDAPPASPDEGWDDTPPSSSSAEPGEGDDELTQAFHEEARETLHNLQGYWVRLQRDADDHEASTQCARLLHLLKGAAAVVGFDAIARSAGELHAWLEIVRAQGFTASAVEQLGRGIEDLIEQTLGDRPALHPASDEVTALPTGDEDDEPRRIFFEEARRALDELRAHARHIQATSGIARGVAVTRTERLFHRLKGSALIVGEAPIAEAATRGQALCEALEQIDLDALEALVQHVALLVQPATGAAPGSADGAHRRSLPPAEEWEAYLEESGALLDDLDRRLAKLEQSARPVAELSEMFRLYHTLKGASNSVGLAPIGQQLHLMETFVERAVAAPALPELRQVVTALADEHAAIRANIARASARAALEVDHARTSARLSAIGDRGSGSSSWIASSDPVWAAPTWDARPDGHALESSRASHASHASHASQGESSHAAGEPVNDVSHEVSHGDDASVGRRFVRVAADRLDGMLDTVGELVVARSRILTRIARLRHLQDEDQQRNGAVVRQINDFVESTEFVNLDGRRSRLSARAVRAVRASRVGPRAAVGRAGFGALELDHYEEIHVLSRQLDEAASDITEMRREIGGEMQRLTEDAESLSTIVTDLQTEITQARMLAVETLFNRLQLPIRDAAQRLGREVEIITRGEDVAIDKAISDALFGPLLHVVRNAVVHGIEEPGRRQELGKARAGTLSLAARDAQGQVVLEISDDGQGIDVARLKAIGVTRGLIPADVPDDDPRVLELVFVHGVSTSDEADDIAGRGVGGNVIRRAVERLNGAIEITSSRGAGTTFRITLPLSMSITQALIMRSAGVTIAVPLAFTETIVTREVVEVVETFGRARVVIAGNLMPVHQTRRLFGDAQERAGGVLVVCAVGGERIAIHADEVLGQEEIVVKSLGNLLDGHPLFSGSTQRGDGELVLIVDVPGVVAAETASGHVPAAPRLVEPLVARGAPRREPASDLPTVEGDASSWGAAGSVVDIMPLPAGKLRVLFVDDSLSVRKVAERMLLGLGVDVVTAVDGQDALEKLRTTSFSLVFTDLEMPRVHGYELIREMRYLPAYSAIPVVVVSSRSGQKHIDQALGLGAREYLTKPFSAEILNAVLSRLIRMEPLS